MPKGTFINDFSSEGEAEGTKIGIFEQILGLKLAGQAGGRRKSEKGKVVHGCSLKSQELNNSFGNTCVDLCNMNQITPSIDFQS